MYILYTPNFFFTPLLYFCRTCLLKTSRHCFLFFGSTSTSPCTQSLRQPIKTYVHSHFSLFTYDVPPSTSRNSCFRNSSTLHLRSHIRFSDGVCPCLRTEGDITLSSALTSVPKPFQSYTVILLTTTEGHQALDLLSLSNMCRVMYSVCHQTRLSLLTTLSRGHPPETDGFKLSRPP